MMRYESLLASRYIKAQKRQSVFTCVSIIAAVAVITMIFTLYGVCMNCLKNAFYSSAPYHLVFSELTEEQGEAMADFEEVRSVKLSRTQDGTVRAAVLFGSDIGDRETWLMNAAEQIGASQQYQRSKNNSMHGAYEWNDNLMMIDGIGDGAHLFKLRIFCIFFIFAVLIAFALRLIIDTAFEVSSKERERHYGVLQSIGATPEQIVRIITYEGLRLCIIGVPFGLMAGIGLAYLMYNVLLASGLSDLFQGMTNAKIYLPFSIDWKMLLVAAAVGVVWVFLSAYGVGMRIIKKTPMEAITTRANNVENVKRHSLSGLLFGVSGSIASRNARRQKKRFVITVLTLTVSITMFALFTSIANTVEKSFLTYQTSYLYGEDMSYDYSADIGNNNRDVSFEDSVQQLADSGLFKDISVEVMEQYSLEDSKQKLIVRYLNREAYAEYFGDGTPVSYDELVRTGGYVLNQESKDSSEVSEAIMKDTLQINTSRRTLPAGLDTSGMMNNELSKVCGYDEPQAHEVSVLGNVNRKQDGAVLFGAIETYQHIAEEWYGDNIYGISAAFSYNGKGNYNAADHKKALDWFKEHSDTVSLEADLYETRWKTQNIMASVRAGVMILNVLIALAALINLLNIISTGIANRRSELASLQCMGMTDRQLDRMAMIECLQFTGAAAIISALICAIIIFGTKFGMTALINASMVDESAGTRKMLISMVQIDPVKPFVRIVISSIAAFAAGCVTSLVMLRTQNSDSLSDQIRGSEMKLDAKRSHILRNSVIAVLSAVVIAITGLRTYSVVSYLQDRKEYEKAGYLNLVDSNGFKMNVYSTGAEHGRHTIVGLAGQASYAFPVETTELNELLGKENTLVYPDRAGYGFSGDSLKPRTVEQIVEDYRTGLKNAGFEAPYVLMAHSIADFYALYWEMQYPDEVEAIVILDGSIPPKNELWQTYTVEEEFPSEDAGRTAMRRLVLRTWLGMNRLFPDRSYDGGATQGAATFSEEQLRLSKLCNNRFWTAAFASEILLEKQEVTHMGEILHPTDTPKLYFSTLYTCEADVRASLERMKADHEAEGKAFNIDPETAARAEWKQIEWEIEQAQTEEDDFMDKIGNCRLEYVAGDHGIFYAQEPEQIASSILGFLAETTE